MLFEILKRMIESAIIQMNNTERKQELRDKIDIFYAANSITLDEFNQLYTMLGLSSAESSIADMKAALETLEVTQ